jgi:hypothetical protein
MKSLFFGLFVFGFLWPSIPLQAESTPSAILSAPNKPMKASVVLDVTPIRVKPLKEGKGADALEKLPEELGPSAMIVVFRITRVLRGELYKLKSRELSLWDQAKDAVDDKNILKLVTMDFHRPEEGGAGRTSFSMVVTDPYASFGIKEGEGSPKQRYRISLARVRKNPDSYLLVKSEKF